MVWRSRADRAKVMDGVWSGKASGRKPHRADPEAHRADPEAHCQCHLLRREPQDPARAERLPRLHFVLTTHQPPASCSGLPPRATHELGSRGEGWQHSTCQTRPTCRHESSFLGTAPHVDMGTDGHPLFSCHSWPLDTTSGPKTSQQQHLVAQVQALCQVSLAECSESPEALLCPVT